MDLTFIKIEDGRDCILLDEFTFDNNKYVVLVNSLNKDDFIVKKISNNDLIGLDNEEELKKVLWHYLDIEKSGDRNE